MYFWGSLSDPAFVLSLTSLVFLISSGQTDRQLVFIILMPSPPCQLHWGEISEWLKKIKIKNKGRKVMCLTNKTRCRPAMSLQGEADYQPCLAQCQSAGTPIAKNINHNGLLQMLSQFIHTENTDVSKCSLYTFYNNPAPANRSTAISLLYW